MQQVFTSYPCTLLLIGLLSSSVASGGQIDIRISGIASNDGAARIVLMTGIQGYNGQRPVTLTESVQIQDGRAQLQVEVPVGTYAIIAHHDRDADDILDRPLFALPVEPYGYSNGAWTSFGLPDFADVAFDVGDGVTQQHIQLRTNVFVTLAQLIVVAAIAIALLFGALAVYRRFHYPKHHSA